MTTREMNLARTARALGFDPTELPREVAKRSRVNRWARLKTSARFGLAPPRSPRATPRGLARTVA